MYLGRRMQDFGESGRIYNNGGASYLLNQASVALLGAHLDDGDCRPHTEKSWEDVLVRYCAGFTQLRVSRIDREIYHTIFQGERHCSVVHIIRVSRIYIEIDIFNATARAIWNALSSSSYHLYHGRAWLSACSLHSIVHYFCRTPTSRESNGGLTASARCAATLLAQSTNGSGGTGTLC